MPFDSLNKGKEMKDYFNMEFSISFSCESKLLQMPVVSKKGRLFSVKHYFINFMDAHGKFLRGN